MVTEGIYCTFLRECGAEKNGTLPSPEEGRKPCSRKGLLPTSPIPVATSAMSLIRADRALYWARKDKGIGHGRLGWLLRAHWWQGRRVDWSHFCRDHARNGACQRGRYGSHSPLCHSHSCLFRELADHLARHDPAAVRRDPCARSRRDRLRRSWLHDQPCTAAAPPGGAGRNRGAVGYRAADRVLFASCVLGGGLGPQGPVRQFERGGRSRGPAHRRPTLKLGGDPVHREPQEKRRIRLTKGRAARHRLGRAVSRRCKVAKPGARHFA